MAFCKSKTRLYSFVTNPRRHKLNVLTICRVEEIKITGNSRKRAQRLYTCYLGLCSYPHEIKFNNCNKKDITSSPAHEPR